MFDYFFLWNFIVIIFEYIERFITIAIVHALEIGKLPESNGIVKNFSYFFSFYSLKYERLIYIKIQSFL